MWIDSVVEALRSIFNRLGLGSKKTAAKLPTIRNGAAQEKTPKPLPPPVGDGDKSNQTGHGNSEPSGQPESSSDGQEPEEVPSQPANSTEADPDELSIIDSLTSNVEEKSPPKAGEQAKNGELNGSEARSSGNKDCCPR